jgi:hypothetical protein
MTVGRHKVLIFGERVFGPTKPDLSIEYCDVEAIAFPDEYEDLSKLADYDLVILDYSAFACEERIGPFPDYEAQQEIFEKQMLDALDKGGCFCILHYDEEVPPYDQYNLDHGQMDRRGIEECESTQIGFRWLHRLRIRPYRKDSPVLNAALERSEFKLYQERWGASKNLFKPYGGGKFQDVILSLGNGYAIGFTLSVRRGKIIYLPCQRDFQRPQLIEECLTDLVNSIITYMTCSSTEIPPWAAVPLFPMEADLRTQLSELELKIESLKGDLEPYQIAKTLAFLSEYEFEKAVPEFFTSHLGLPTLRHEEYKEDFWILDSRSERIVIAETKSHARGLKRSDIYSLYNHREANELDETFPALLVINAHLNAGSWKEKIRRIDAQDYQIAASHNILIARIEDLLFAWNAIAEERISQEELLSTLLTENGWMEVSEDGAVTIHK